MTTPTPTTSRNHLHHPHHDTMLPKPDPGSNPPLQALSHPRHPPTLNHLWPRWPEDNILPQQIPNHSNIFVPQSLKHQILDLIEVKAATPTTSHNMDLLPPQLGSSTSINSPPRRLLTPEVHRQDRNSSRFSEMTKIWKTPTPRMTWRMSEVALVVA